MPYTMDADELGKVTAIRDCLTAAKQLLQDAEQQMASATSNASALMAIQKTKGRADSYNAAYAAKGGLIRANGAVQATRGEMVQFHATVSADLQRMFTDGPAFALAAPGR